MLHLLIFAPMVAFIAIVVSFASSVLVAGVAVVSSVFLFLGGLGLVAAVSTSLTVMAGFASSVFVAAVAAISSPFLFLGGLGIVAAVCTSLTVMASFAASVVVAGVAVISSAFLFLGGLSVAATVCTPFVLMAGFAASVFLAGVAIISSTFLTISGLAASHYLGIINLAPAVLGIMNMAAKATFIGIAFVARAALFGASTTAGMAQSLRVEKKRPRAAVEAKEQHLYRD